MNSKSSDSIAMRWLVAMATVLSAPTFAQQPGDEPIEEVVVTGSRIARPGDFGNSSPIDTIAVVVLIVPPMENS